MLNHSFGQNVFKLEGFAPDIFNGQKIYLNIYDRYSNNRFEQNDSVLIKNNTFIFEGKINKPSEIAILYSKKPNGYLNLVIDSGLNKIFIKQPELKSPIYRNKLSNSDFINSKSNLILKKIDSLTNEFYFKNGKPSKENKYITVLHDSTKKILKEKSLNIIKNNIDNYYSLIYLYSKLYSLTSNELIETFDQLSIELKESELGIELYKSIQQKKNSSIGSAASNFEAIKKSGELFSNSSLKGNPYIIAFGATWCLPCKERMPKLIEIFKKYEQKGLRVIYVNLDNNLEKWKSQTKNNGDYWIDVSENVIWKNSKISKLYSVKTLPLYVIIDKAGNIVYNENELRDLDIKMIEEYIETVLK
jgi:thiol-disulfide isomerase/thioredoxin